MELGADSETQVREPTEPKGQAATGRGGSEGRVSSLNKSGTKA